MSSLPKWMRRLIDRLLMIKVIEIPLISYEYSNSHTLHGTTDLEIELYKGQVVAVWYGNQPLPFRQSVVDAGRAADMREMDQWGLDLLTGVEVVRRKH